MKKHPLDDFDADIRDHIERETKENIERGMSPEEARYAALRKFGNVMLVREDVRTVWIPRWLDEINGDLRYAVRLLRRNPIFAVAAALSLAIGIGASTTVFTAANTLLLRTAPGVAQPNRLVDINRTTGELGVEPILYPQYLEIRERVTLVEGVYAYGLNLSPMSLMDETTQGGAEPVFANVVTPNYFAVLGVRPSVGRVFGEHDAESVVVLSYRFWTRRFNADPAVVGTTLRLTDRLYTVVGVVGQEFHGNTILAPDLWLPFDRTRPLNLGLVGARLKPGVSIAQAGAEMETIGRTLAGDPQSLGSTAPDVEARRRRLGLSVTRSSPVPAGVRLLVAGFLALLMGITILVLVIACANVAGILLTRATARRQEIAVRLAMGVDRARLIRQLLTETVFLFCIGGAAGLVLSRAMNLMIMRVLPAFPLPANVSLEQDWRVVAFAMAISFVTAVAFGLAPAFQASKVDVVSILKAHDHGPATRLRLRHAFVVAQVALSVLLVVVGGLLSRALGRVGSVGQGFDARGVEVAALDLSLAGYMSATGVPFVRDLIARIRQLPDVQAVAVAYASPSGGLMGFRIAVPGATPPNGAPIFQSLGNVIAPGYFAAMRIPLITGRDFTDADSETAEALVIVGESAVRRFWPGTSIQEAIGRHILVQPMLLETGPRSRPTATPLRVIGVAADLLRFRNGESPQPFIYVPLYQRYVPTVRILARTVSGRRIAAELRAIMTRMDPRLPVLSTMALEDEGSPVVTQLRIATAVSASLGLVGYLLAAIGIYGVTANMVIRRTREIGIRVVLGAERAHLVRMVLGEGMRLVAIGSALGLLLAAISSRLLTNLLFGVPNIDPVTFGGTVALFAAIGLTACYVPVRRAVRTDPMAALRYE